MKKEGYYFIDGNKYVSVTKVIGEIGQKHGLDKWKVKVACEFMKQNPTANIMEAMGEPDRKRDEGGSRGSAVHNLIEAVDDKSIDYTKISENILPYIKAYNKFVDENNPETIMKEKVVVNKMFDYAGKLDRICKINKLIYLLDFKTSAFLDYTVGWQLVAYKYAVSSELNDLGYTIDKIGAVQLKKDGNYKLVPYDTGFESWLCCLYLWREINGLPKLDTIKIGGI